MKTCSRCKKTRSLDDFWIERRRNKPKSVCKICAADVAREWRENNPNAGRIRYSKERAAVRERHLIRKYGISLAQYDMMLKAQDGKCAICKAPEIDQFKSVFHVDHCHTTGRVRGLLCRGCNHILGTVKDNPETLQRAISYLIVPQVAAEVISAFLEVRP